MLIGYQPGSSDLADFLQVAVNGSDTRVSVDADGSGTNAVSVAVIDLLGVTGLTAQGLLQDENLIVA